VHNWAVDNLHAGSSVFSFTDEDLEAALSSTDEDLEGSAHVGT
jgi:hypothetical protein